MKFGNTYNKRELMRLLHLGCSLLINTLCVSVLLSGKEPKEARVRTMT